MAKGIEIIREKSTIGVLPVVKGGRIIREGLKCSSCVMASYGKWCDECGVIIEEEEDE